jgi:hypothetical protein
MDLIEGVRNEVLKGSIGTKGSLGKGPGKGWDCEKHSSQCATCAVKEEEVIHRNTKKCLWQEEKA